MLSEPRPSISTDFESLPLTTALRLSMADEVDDIPRGAESLHQGEEQGEDGMTLAVPENLPVDLRGKLAVCLIHTDQKPPEVCVWVGGCMCVWGVGACVCGWVGACVCGGWVHVCTRFVNRCSIPDD